MPKFNQVIVVSDGIRGHYHQSRGIAQWLNRLGGVEILEPFNIPKLSGMKKFMKLKISARKLPFEDEKFSRKWLHDSGVSIRRSEPDTTLFISAGSSAAPFCLALAKATGNKSAVVMTPSILGTKPFDYAIIPEHDSHDSHDKNIMTTLGAPNHIYIPELRNSAENFFIGRNFQSKVVALLIGGSDSNYNPHAKWAIDALGALRYIPETTILLTTSRRTSQALEIEIKDMFMSNRSTGYILILSENPKVNAVTSLLGAATHVLATEDSVSMVSEAVTAGFKVGLLRVPKTEGHAIKKHFGYGTKKFDEMFAKMKNSGLIEDLGETPDYNKFLEPPEQKHHKDFNEAKRAAEWILS